VFSQAKTVGPAVAAMLLTGLFIKLSNGATYAVTPFINKKAMGAVAGLVGAGGNIGAVAAGFLFKSSSSAWPQALLLLGILVAASSGLALFVKFSEADETSAHLEMKSRLGAVWQSAPVSGD
jgi:NNP family nitrate/nitrite transporter-like MFS transporter